MIAIISALFGTKEKELHEAFNLGKRAGYEEGVRDGMARNFERSEELSEQEYNEVIEFLVSKGLELCCYDINKGGFRIRKRNYGKSRN